MMHAGCGKQIFVAGTNGGQVPCGASVTIFGKTSQQFCDECYSIVKTKRDKANRTRRARNQAMRDCGLVRVRGALGGIYWE